MSDTPKPGWLSFSIRDLLWLTTLVAVVVWSRYERPNTPGRYTMELNQASYHTYLLDTAKGKTLKVKVVADGFEYEGEGYKSLSAVAKKITGQHMNGFLFFRLKGAKA